MRYALALMGAGLVWLALSSVETAFGVASAVAGAWVLR